MTFRASALRLGIAAAALALTAGTAKAEILVNDTTLVFPYNKTEPQSGGWTDIIGPDDFQTTGIGATIDRVAGTVILNLYTNWRLGNLINGARTGDIWLDLDQDPTTGLNGFESAIVFDPANNEAPSPIYTRAPVGFYDGTGGNQDVTWRTVFNVWDTTSGIVGAKYCAPGTVCTAGSTNNPLPGTQPDTLSVVNNLGPNPGTTGSVAAIDFESGIRITLSGLGSGPGSVVELFYDGFEIGWGTGDCGNDVIVGTVPVPAALPLMLTALGGLGLIMRRRAGDAA